MSRGGREEQREGERDGAERKERERGGEGGREPYPTYPTLLPFPTDDDELIPPVEIHSRKSLAEKDDDVPPLRPLLPTNRRGGFRKPFISTHSDAADSAVSMVHIFTILVCTLPPEHSPGSIIKELHC